MASLLEVRDLKVAFGGLRAVSGVSLTLESGSITGLIGPNGSGKSTLFNLITGVLHPEEGQVVLDGQVITRWAPHRIATLGLARTFQLTRVFGQMTVWENLMVVPTRPGSTRSAQDRAVELLQRVNLYELRAEAAADLSYGQSKLLELIRALMLEPRLLMLDEPFAGVNPTLAQSIVDLLRTLSDRGTTLFIIDHAMTIIMALCERLLVMDMGELIADGLPGDIQKNERVLDAYFGRTATASSVDRA